MISRIFASTGCSRSTKLTASRRSAPRPHAGPAKMRSCWSVAHLDRGDALPEDLAGGRRAAAGDSGRQAAFRYGCPGLSMTRMGSLPRSRGRHRLCDRGDALSGWAARREFTEVKIRANGTPEQLRNKEYITGVADDVADKIENGGRHRARASMCRMSGSCRCRICSIRWRCC